jgi:pyruvate dehydrogenase E2 component (dihydrolipoamide acetyltransferase)
MMGLLLHGIRKLAMQVKSGELLAEVETDKATMEYESYNTGTLLYIGAEAGKSVPVNGVLAIIGEKGADWQTLLKAHQAKSGAIPAGYPLTSNQSPGYINQKLAPVTPASTVSAQSFFQWAN